MMMYPIINLDDVPACHTNLRYSTGSVRIMCGGEVCDTCKNCFFCKEYVFVVKNNILSR
jgi:hypothetical protein